MVDAFVELYESLKPEKNNQGSVTSQVTVTREILLSIASHVCGDCTNEINNSAIKQRLGIRTGTKESRKFDSKLDQRDERFDLLVSNTKEAFEEILKRKENSNKIPLALPVEFWHEHITRVDSNARNLIWVRDKVTGKMVQHPRHYYEETILTGYRRFLKWKKYLDYITNGGLPISIHIFARGRCVCMRKRQLRTCVDMIITQMECYLTAHSNATRLLRMQERRENCECNACLNKIHSKLNSGCESLRHLVICPKVEHVPYGVPGLLNPPFLYPKRCCVRGEDEKCNGGIKCMVFPEVCKQNHTNTKPGEHPIPLCQDCGIEKLELCPYMTECEDLSVLVHVYGESKRGE